MIKLLSVVVDSMTGDWQVVPSWRIKKPTFDELWMSGNDQAEKL